MNWINERYWAISIQNLGDVSGLSEFINDFCKKHKAKLITIDNYVAVFEKDEEYYEK